MCHSTHSSPPWRGVGGGVFRRRGCSTSIPTFLWILYFSLFVFVLFYCSGAQWKFWFLVPDAPISSLPLNIKRVNMSSTPSRQKKKKKSGATFHTPLTKSATLNRLLHCSIYGNFQGLFFDFRGLIFALRGRNRPQPQCNFFPDPIPISLTLSTNGSFFCIIQ